MRRDRKLFIGNRLRVGNGLLAWYDVSRDDFLTLSGSKITQCLDRSGNANHSDVQATSSKQPERTEGSLNGLSGATADGNDALDLPSSVYSLAGGNNTIFGVGKRTTEAGDNDSIVAFTTSSSPRLLIRFGGTSGTVNYRSSASGSILSNGSNTNTKPQMMTGFRSGTTASISVAGGTPVTNTDASDVLNVDSAQLANGSGGLLGVLYEVILYNRTLTTWILSYTSAEQTTIHASKLNRDEV